MTRRSLLAWSSLVLVLSASGDARAAAATAFAETSRVAALSDAVTARPGDAGSMFLNPGGLADLTEPQVILSGTVDSLGQWFARTGEARSDLSRPFGAFGLAAAAPLPGPWWLRRVKVGVALDLPAQYVLSVDIPYRADQPTSPMYDARPNRASALAAIAVDVIDQVKIGAGVNLTPSLSTPTTATLVPGRSSTIQNDVVVDLDREMPLAASPFVGIRSQLLSYLSLGLVYRGSSVSHAGGPETTTAGPIVAAEQVDYLIFWEPTEVAFGVEIGPWKGVSLSIDTTYSEWSSFRTELDQAPSPGFKDTTSVMAGLEWTTRPWLTLRAGGGYDPSPVPAETGEDNYLGAAATVLAAGAGVNLRTLFGFPLMVDAHVRGRFGAEQAVAKNAASLPDADTTTPGQQIDNLGYPGFSSRSSLYQAGLTLTIFAGKERR